MKTVKIVAFFACIITLICTPILMRVLYFYCAKNQILYAPDRWGDSGLEPVLVLTGAICIALLLWAISHLSEIFKHQD